MLTILLVVLAAESEPQRGHIAVTGTALFPLDRGLPGAGGLEAGFEPTQQVRCLFVATFAGLYSQGRGRSGTEAWGLIPRLMTGVEAVITPWLPLELTAGAVLGPGFGNVSDVGNVPMLTGQLRAALGFRVTSWFTPGLFMTGNAVLLPLGPFWGELGARLAFRW